MNTQDKTSISILNQRRSYRRPLKHLKRIFQPIESNIMDETYVEDQESDEISKRMSKLHGIVGASHGLKFQLTKEQNKLINFPEKEELEADFLQKVNSVRPMRSSINQRLNPKCDYQLTGKELNCEKDLKTSCVEVSTFDTMELKTEDLILSAFKMNSQNTIEQGFPELKRGCFIAYKKKSFANEYELNEEVGSGSFSTVYKCTQLKCLTVRTVKVIQKYRKGQNNPYIKNEIEALKQLDHPHIVKLYEIFEDGDKYYFVMQKCNGGSLNEYLQNKKKQLSKQTKKEILRQIFYAVGYLHQKGYIHRDLKPANIMLVNKLTSRSTADEVVVKIIDFGLAIKFDGKSFQTCVKIGTSAFMAPEVYQGIYSDKCDVWSCGVIMHQLLLGNNPYIGQEVNQIQSKVKGYNIEKSCCWRDLQQKERLILKKLLNKNYIIRQNIREIMKDEYFKVKVTLLPSQRQQILHKLNTFKRSNNVIVEIMQYFILFQGTSQSKISYLGKLFSILDNQQEGFLRVQSFSQLMPSEGSKQLKKMFKKLDLDNSQSIEFTQFVYLMSGRQQVFTLPNMTKLFDLIDKRTSKQINLVQFKAFINKICRINGQRINQLIEQMDINKDCSISQEEFIFYLLKKGSFGIN